MTQLPEDLRYTDRHEWVRISKGRIRVGLTPYFFDEEDLKYVTLPTVGSSVALGDVCASVETKLSKTKDVIAPASGIIASINEAVVEDPALLRESSYEEAWLFEIEINDPSQLDNLLTADAYHQLVQ